jgi:murein DD-endopeptidase MepM/ murein hydrolase activator NlpD
MSRVAELLSWRGVPHAAALALILFAFAGCSAENATRFQNPFSNPFASQPEATGSVGTPQVSSGAAPVLAAPQSYPTASGEVSGESRGTASYTPPPQPPNLETTGTVSPRSIAASQASGTKIIVGSSDTLEVLAQRYHVTSSAILAANGYRGPRALSPGQSLIIPQRTVATTAKEHGASASKRTVANAAHSVHVVNRGDTLRSIARRYNVSVAELARANKIKTAAKLKLGSKLNVPSKAAAAVPAAPNTAPQQVAAAPAPATQLATAAPQSARLAQASATAEDSTPEIRARAGEATGALPTFRWPVRGKVIAGYGAKTNGKSNDGINLAVPEGTPVKAAEDGVVAYAGNELKGYGNLVLVRHASGYVTAYAHASELLVKRGDTIKRGQVIAKSGQSGEATSPQLHFEIRKGSTPVDPLQFLNGA